MRFSALIIIAATATLAAGCGGARQADEFLVAHDATESERKRAMERQQAKVVYEAAREFLEAGEARRALEIYDELQAHFPFSEFATQSELESIYANYRAYRTEAALAAADRFIKQHPRHANIDYVYYLRGLINFERNSGEVFLGSNPSERDPTYLRQAFTDFNLLIRNYPDSPYNRDARLRMIEIRHRLAAYELAVAEYYLRRRAWVAASRRAEHVIERYQGADSMPRALEILEHAYRMLGLEDLARDARTVLQTSYPNQVTDYGLQVTGEEQEEEKVTAEARKEKVADDS